jgi:hypothetical protein
VGLNVRPLGEFLETIAELDPDETIFVADTAAVLPETPATLGPATESAPPGYRYLLEVATAQEVLEVWSAWRDGRNPTLAEKVIAVDHYARMDAYLPVGS